MDDSGGGWDGGFLDFFLEFLEGGGMMGCDAVVI